MAIDGQPAGEDTIGPGADIRLGLIVIDAFLQAMTHCLQVLVVVRCELRYHRILNETPAFREETHFLHKALHIAVGATMIGKLVVQKLFVNVIGHIIRLTAFLMCLHRIILGTNLILGGLKYNTEEEKN